jgi:uridine kinase
MSTMSSNVWYAIAERMGRNKASFTFGIYGKVCAGKQSFARALAGRMDAEGWHRVFLPIDLYLKANRENRTVMLKKGFSDYGFTEEYDKIQLEAYAIDEKALAEDINGIKERKNVTRSGLYDVNTGKHTGILSVASSRWNSTAAAWRRRTK